jgi:hypothetical protein
LGDGAVSAVAVGCVAAGGLVATMLAQVPKQRKDAEDCDDEDKDRLREDLVVEGGDEHYT